MYLQNHQDDFVGTVLGSNPATYDQVSEGSSKIKEWINMFNDQPTVHSCYGGNAPEKCTGENAYGKPQPPEYELWRKEGATDLEIKKVILECVISSPRGGVISEGRSQNEIVLSHKCIANAGYIYFDPFKGKLDLNNARYSDSQAKLLLGAIFSAASLFDTEKKCTQQLQLREL